MLDNEQDLTKLKRYQLLLILAEVKMMEYDINKAIDVIDAEELALDYLKLTGDE